MRYTIITLIIICMSLSAAMPAGELSEPAPHTSNQLLTEITDTPADDWYHWWVGVGEVSNYGISNTIQGGIFGYPWNDGDPYTGEKPPSDPPVGPGSGGNGEFPTGSVQTYLYSMGPWFGAITPSQEVNMSKGAPHSDMGGMSSPEMESGGAMHDISHLGLYMSDMVIPYYKNYIGEGDHLFVQPGEEAELYQKSWPFTDLSINMKRTADKFLVQGDIVSNQDSYAVGGDWIPAEEATCIWARESGNYDGEGLGIRIEQRTYSWADVIPNVIVINFKIRNMNSYTLERPYFGYFMDADVGQTSGMSPGDPGPLDDLVGFNPELKLGYTYDSDGTEPGWVTPTGYGGAVLLYTPHGIDMTGFETWITGDEVDDDGNDALKYAKLSSTDFVAWEDPNDVRMLLNSGPYPDMAPGKEYDYTLAVIFAETEENLFSTVEEVELFYENGFLTGISERPETETGFELSVDVSVSAGLVCINYVLPDVRDIDLKVFDASGRKITTLFNGPAQSGSHQLSWDASSATSGVYFIKLSGAGQSISERITIIK